MEDRIPAAAWILPGSTVREAESTMKMPSNFDLLFSIQVPNGFVVEYFWKNS